MRDMRLERELETANARIAELENRIEEMDAKQTSSNNALLAKTMLSRKKEARIAELEAQNAALLDAVGKLEVQHAEN